jgi:hypothetical protein
MKAAHPGSRRQRGTRLINSRSRNKSIASIATVLAATVLSLTACESDNHGGNAAQPTAPSSSASSSAAGSTNPAADQYNQLALQILDAVVRGDDAAATAHFDTDLKEKLPPDKVAASWAAYQQTFGNYQSHGGPQQVPLGDLTVVNVPLQMSQQPGEFRVTFHNDQTVAGLFFLRTGVPVS